MEETSNKIQDTKVFDLEDRTLIFSKKVLDLLKKLDKNTVNFVLINQVSRSACSVGANYREANDSLGKRDFFLRLRICRKESKETTYWLELLLHVNPQLSSLTNPLIQESKELTKIFSAIIKKGLFLG